MLACRSGRVFVDRRSVSCPFIPTSDLLDFSLCVLYLLFFALVVSFSVVVVVMVAMVAVWQCGRVRWLSGSGFSALPCNEYGTSGG